MDFREWQAAPSRDDSLCASRTRVVRVSRALA